MKYTDTTLAYLAGFLEADGCIQTTGLRITNRCPKVLTWLQDNFGGSVTEKSTPINCYDWNLHGDEGLKLALLVYPYLLFKRPQVDILIKYRATLRKRGSKTPPEVVEYRKQLKEELSEEKGRWRG